MLDVFLIKAIYLYKTSEHTKMTRLSVNINKVATLRNARGRTIPIL